MDNSVLWEEVREGDKMEKGYNRELQWTLSVMNAHTLPGALRRE